MKKNKELILYEKLGIKTFKKLVFHLRDILLIPITKDKTKEERKRMIYNTPSNYNIGKINSIEDIIHFKKQLAINTSIHLIGLLICIYELININNLSMISIIINTLLTILNTYCLILQRYNLVRINEYVKEKRIRDKKQLDKKEYNKSLDKDINNTMNRYYIEENIKSAYYNNEKVLVKKYKETNYERNN